MVVPFGQFRAGPLTTQFEIYQDDNPSDSNTHLIDLGSIPGLPSSGDLTVPSVAAYDSLHPNVDTHGELAATVALAIGAL